jgi:hypothetical protein
MRTYAAATLRTLLTEDALDEDEKFLRSYVLGDEWKVLTEKERSRRDKPTYRYSVYLLYWYKSTNTDKPTYRDIVGQEVDTSEDEEVRGLLALLVQKYKY